MGFFWKQRSFHALVPKRKPGTRMPHVLDDPEHWAKRAEEARAIAGELIDADARQMMLGIAEGYERLAKRAAERAKSHQRLAAGELEVHAVGDDIIVNLPGTRCTITFQRTSEGQTIEEKHGWARDDPMSTVSKPSSGREHGTLRLTKRSN
jgi:hypothetical protein